MGICPVGICPVGICPGVFVLESVALLFRRCDILPLSSDLMF